MAQTHTQLPDAEEMWSKFSKTLYERDQVIAKAWKEEIDTLLTFAGLYSVILTAFNVELYKLLEPEDSGSLKDDQIIRLLVTAFTNDSGPAVPAKLSTPTSATSAVWINALMFSSLILGLSSAFIGIVIRQWLTHFLHPYPGDGERSAHLHCLRWDKGLADWWVHEILSCISILLQIALAFFLSGLVIFLWTLDTRVATAAASFAGALGIFWIVTTVAPTFRPHCPYKSPQSLVCRCILHELLGLGWSTQYNGTMKQNTAPKPKGIRRLLRIFGGSWASLELSFVKSMPDGNHSYGKILKSIQDNIFSFGHTLLMDEKLICEVVRQCAVNIIPDPGHDSALPKEILDMIPIQSISSSLASLRCLQRLLECQVPVSQTTQTVIATSANSLLNRSSLPMSALDAEGLIQVWDMIPYVCAGGSETMTSVLRYLADYQENWGTREIRETRATRNPVSSFAQAIIKYQNCSQIWLQDKLSLENETLSVLTYVDKVINHIDDLIVVPSRPTWDPSDLCNACGLAMLLINSLPVGGLNSEEKSRRENIINKLVTEMQDLYSRGGDYAKLLLPLARGYHTLRNFSSPV